jgi:integrase
MGRQAEGVRVKPKRGWYYAHFTWEKHAYRIALQTKDKREAEKAAARAYAKVVSGEWRAVRRAPGRLRDLADLMSEWIESKRPSIDEATVPTLEGYARRFVDYFERLDAITEASATNYGLARLGQVLRTTVLRELSYLREFLTWCRVQGALLSTPHIPALPPKAQGKRTGPQRAKAVHISPDEAHAILELLPEESKTIGGRKWPLRARFEFMWETALRPETLSRLSVPDNWRPGMTHLELTNEDDKARFGREVDLTPGALAILKRVARDKGPVFGRHNYSKAIKRAAREVLGPARGAKFAPYDFRHGRARALLDAGAPIRGVSYVLGHKRVSTTDKYLAPERSAGKAALRAISKDTSENAPKAHRANRGSDGDGEN